MRVNAAGVTELGGLPGPRGQARQLFSPRGLKVTGRAKPRDHVIPAFLVRSAQVRSMTFLHECVPPGCRAHTRYCRSYAVAMPSTTYRCPYCRNALQPVCHGTHRSTLETKCRRRLPRTVPEWHSVGKLHVTFIMEDWECE